MSGIKNPFPKLMMLVQGIKFGKKCSFYGMPVIIQKNKGSIVIGQNVTINSSFTSNFIGLYQRSVIIARDGGRIVIGDNTGLSGATIYARNLIKIGKGTLIGANTKILDNDFHPVDPELRRINPNDSIKSKPVVIGDNVFIGCNTIILKGVTIGDNSVIGAGSVITCDIPAASLAAGNPARIIRSLQ